MISDCRLIACAYISFTSTFSKSISSYIMLGYYSFSSFLIFLLSSEYSFATVFNSRSSLSDSSTSIKAGHSCSLISSCFGGSYSAFLSIDAFFLKNQCWIRSALYTQPRMREILSEFDQATWKLFNHMCALTYRIEFKYIRCIFFLKAFTHFKHVRVVIIDSILKA